MRHLSGPTFAPSTLERGVAEWMASLPASRAKTSVLPVGAPGSMASAAASSSKSFGSQPIAVRGSCFWRTSQASLLPPPPLWTRPKASSTNARPPESWENWPTSGGMRSGSLFLRPTWAPATGARDGSASRGAWLTPAGMAGIDSTGKAGAGGEFAQQATQWMTPAVPNGGRAMSAALVSTKGTTPDGDKRTVPLEAQVKHWPTPVVTDANGARNATSGRSNPDSKHHAGTTLNDAILMWPTPDASMHAGGNTSQGPAGFRPNITLAAAAWPTPRATTKAGDTGSAQRLAQGANPGLYDMAKAWPTPSARDHKSERGGKDHGALQPPQRPDALGVHRALGIFAPGPADPRWAGILAEHPELAPALEPTFRSVVDGLAFDMGDSRAARLKCVGNGVVALCAATAFVVVARRAGLFAARPTLKAAA